MLSSGRNAHFHKNERFVPTRASKSRFEAFQNACKIVSKTQCQSLSFLNRLLMDLASILDSKSNGFPINWDLVFQHRALEAPKTLSVPSQDAPRTLPRRPKTLPRATLASILEPFCSPRRSQDPPNSHLAYILEAFGSQDHPFDEIWSP